jgi:hypothetical protein
MIARRYFLLAGLCVGLASCGPPPPLSPKYPDISFSGETPLVLDVARIDVRSLVRPGQFDQDFPAPPLQALANWARDRLRAGGNGNLARFTIVRADATEKNLPIKGGISGTFTDQVSQEYDVAVDATLEILDAHGMAVRSVHVSASRSRSVLQSATPNDRDKVRYELVKDVMGAFDRQMEAQIRDNFGLYLLSR